MPAPPVPPPPRPAYDGVSVAGLVCAAVCVLAPVGLALGIAGIVRTRRGRRRGRWAAVTAVALGAVGTLLTGIALGYAWQDAGTIRPARAEVGQCADLDRRPGSAGVRLRERDCDRAHDVEVVHTGTFDRALLASYGDVAPDAFCRGLLSDDLRARLDPEEIHLGVVIAGRVGRPEAGAAFVCYADGRTGPLTGPVNAVE